MRDRRKCAGRPRAFGNVLCQLPLRDYKINAVRRGVFTDRPVKLRGVSAHFQHIAENAYVPSGKRGKRVDRRAVGRRVGVIAIVHKRAVPGFYDTRAAAHRFIPGEPARDLRVRKAELKRYRRRREHGVDHICAVGRDSHGKAALPGKNAAGKALAAVLNIRSADSAVFTETEEDGLPSEVRCGKERVVAVGEDDGIGPHALQYLRLGPQDTGTVAERLQMRVADVRKHRHIGMHHVRKARHLPEEGNAHFDHGNVILSVQADE